jgi:outer membrane immunogenic protein
VALGAALEMLQRCVAALGFGLTLGAVALDSTSLRAADLVLKAPAAADPEQPVYGWSGCYVGAGLGYAMSESNWDYRNSNPFTATGNFDPQLIRGANFKDSRAVLGAQAGCNAMVQGPWLIGAEVSWISNPHILEKNNGFDPFQGAGAIPFTTAITNNIRSVLSATARLGFTLGNDWLFYGKGGFALAEIETRGVISPSTPGFDWNDTQWHNGWTVGGGIEYRLFRNVTIGVEYSYYQFAEKIHTGGVSVTDLAVNAQSNPVSHSVSADLQTIMARVNFGFGDPIATQALPQQDSRFTGTFSAFMNSESRFSSWNGTRGVNVFAVEPGRGYQIYSPTLVGFDYDDASAYKLEARIKGGHVYARHETQGQIATYNGPVDTEASFNVTLQNFDTIKPTFGVALNIPTGNSYLPNNQRFARMDSDLVDVGSYGTGFNVNPTAGFVIGLNEATALSLSAGYAWQGKFTKEGIDTSGSFNMFNLQTRVDPGDVFTANANLTTQIGSLSLQASFAYMSETDITIDDRPSGRSGARYVSNLVTQYQFDPQWALTVNLSHTYQEKNDIPNLSGGLVPEPKNSNSHLVIGSVEPSYMVTDNLKVAANYSFLYRSDNFYNQIEDQFNPAKTKHSVGASTMYTFSQNSSIELKGSHAWVEQETGALLPTTLTPVLRIDSVPPSLSYHAWTASIAANIRF